MQGVFTKFLQLWIPNKTDKGTVVTDVFEPNFTKLDQNAESTNQTLTNLKNGKLDKGTYPGTASDIKTEIDNLNSNKYDKTGGKLTGTIEIVGGSNNNTARVDFSNGTDTEGYIGAVNTPSGGQKKHIGIYNFKTQSSIRLYEDGTTAITGNNLDTESKEVIRGMNEIYSLEKGIVGNATINYIQTPGNKIFNQVYFDKSVYPPTPYICINGNTDTTPTSNFILATNANISMRSKRHAKSILYNGGAIVPNGGVSTAISLSEYEFMIVRVRRGTYDLYSKNVINVTAGDVFIEPGVILTIAQTGTVTVKNNGSTSADVGLVEVIAYSFGYLL